ncbi:hypothetical protein ACQP1W_33020 [Spirillospora sp. CA-255316]
MAHIVVRGDEALDSDTVFGVKESLVKDFEHRPTAHRRPTGASSTAPARRPASTSSSPPPTAE